MLGEGDYDSKPKTCDRTEKKCKEYLENIEYNHTKTKNSHNYPDAFVDKGNFITDKNEMVNKFN